MLRRCVLMAVIAILIAGGMAFSQNQGRQTTWEDTVKVDQQPIGPCGSALIVTSYEVDRRIISLYDKGGLVIQQHVHSTTTKPSIYELVDPSTLVRIPGSKVATGVRGENEVDRIDFVKMVAAGQGSIFQVTVPGYGRLFSETGHIVGDLSFNLLSNTGHNDYWEQDLAALCSYLSGQ